MGAAWCKGRAAAEGDSKSAVGRVIVRCVNQMCPAQRTDPAGDTRLDTPAARPDKEEVFHWSRPLPPHGAAASGAWQSAVLTVPESEPPMPPPRNKRRQRRRRSSGQPLGRSRSVCLAGRPRAAPGSSPLRRAGSACDLSAAGPELPRFVFDFTSYSGAKTPPPSPARAVHVPEDILRELGLPASLREEHKLGRSRASSGRSSMTPSLSELEAALSDLLEAGAARDDDEEAEPVSKARHQHRAPPLKEVVA
ncbi:uncharacterized protein LOC134539445 [Bacillus rossius redtenbacheri]|uniref:uncharacterized protein LOC134539445 n=1 Tax=Bacillus rossius redtenbacheri TaxID=93214 RepID=UPI002FDDCD37